MFHYNIKTDTCQTRYKQLKSYNDQLKQKI